MGIFILLCVCVFLTVFGLRIRAQNPNMSKHVTPPPQMDTQQNHLQQFQCCFHNWVAQQKLDLNEMLQTLSMQTPAADENLNLLTKKTINHCQEYLDTRAVLAKHDAMSFLSPSWGTTFSNSNMWVGGCRPSVVFRLIYTLSGSELEAHLDEFLSGQRKGNLAELSAEQLKMIDSLHRKTIKDENELSSRVASLQEDIADEPFVMIAKKCKEIGESSEDVDRAMDAHALSLANVLIDADKLRLSTLKDVMHILTHLQGVELLVAFKKLHLSLYEWGKQRDRKMGIFQNNNSSCSSTTS